MEQQLKKTAKVIFRSNMYGPDGKLRPWDYYNTYAENDHEGECHYREESSVICAACEEEGGATLEEIIDWCNNYNRCNEPLGSAPKGEEILHELSAMIDFKYIVMEIVYE